MRFFKQHPALLALLVLAVLGVFAPVAYAIVDRVFLSVDVTRSEAEIEQDLHHQLDQAGHGNARVKATKTDHEYTIAIESQDPKLAGNLDFQLQAGDQTINLHLELPEWISQEQGQAVGEAASQAVERPNHETDAQLEQQIVDQLAKVGLKDVTAKVTATTISVVVR